MALHRLVVYEVLGDAIEVESISFRELEPEPLVEVLDDPGQRRRFGLVALLRSPFFALDDRLLHELAQERGRGVSWWQLVRESKRPRLTPVREVLQELLAERRLEPPTALLRLADRLTGYTAVIANLPGAERREADWRGFRELVRDLERGADDAFTVVRWLRQLYEAKAEVPRPLLEAGDAVSLMTIHAAKGLEWPVVVIPDLARSVNQSRGKILFDPDLGVAMNFGREGEDEGKPALYRLIADRKARLEEAEAKRVLYVASTRARDHLILTSTTANTQGFCGLNILRKGLGAAGISFSPVPFSPEDAQPPELPNPSPPVPPRLLIEPVR